jgi:hypothetical protein
MLQTAYLITLALLLLLMGWRFGAINRQLSLWLPVYVAIVLAVELLALYVAGVLKASNHWVHNCGMPLYISAVVLFYIRVLPRLRKRGVVLLVIYLLFAGLNLGFFQGWQLFNTYSVMVASVVVLVLTGSYFFSLMRVHDDAPLLREPMFWISAGFFFFYLCNVFAAGTILYFIKTNRGFAALEIQIIQFLNISLLLCLFIGIQCLKPQQNSAAK